MNLVSKYNVPAPRYTSYPTVPLWDNDLSESQWKERVRESFRMNNRNGISLYIHLPFCESLCTYCACNTRITVNHQVEKPYIEALLKEWQLYLDQFDEKPLIREIHLGGGTPTFFSADNLDHLLRSILDTSDLAKDFDFSFEGHPSNTSYSHLQTLFSLGFRRVSFGVQDFDFKVQEAINRFQSIEEVRSVIDKSRSIGYKSINIDLVYGLPYQDIETIRKTIQQVIELKPERIAFYSYAHVPWLKPGQRRYTERELPLDSEKRALYLLGKELFLKAGYHDVGMDHFALKDDALFKAYGNGSLHRNFMGYTTNNTRLLIGLGASSISDSWTAYSQNIKTVEEYEQSVNAGLFPMSKNHSNTKEDLRLRQHILNLMCKYETEFTSDPEDQKILSEAKSELKKLQEDGLILLGENKIIITIEGKQFLRNICLALDLRHHRKSCERQIFSTTA
jgi:oxygen-independent coproporphyrinogen-3 oxidase